MEMKGNYKPVKDVQVGDLISHWGWWDQILQLESIEHSKVKITYYDAYLDKVCSWQYFDFDELYVRSNDDESYLLQERKYNG